MSQEDLSGKVRTWIEKTGLPLELEATAAFTKVGFDCQHSYVYEDPESKKGREIDVLGRTSDRSGLIQIFVAVECKASSKPWIVLTNRTLTHGLTTLALGVSLPDSAKALSEADSFRGELGQHLRWRDRGGYALKQAFSEDVDGAYAATMGALKAASTLIHHEESTTQRLSFALPVLVVDAPIFECETNENGELALQKVAMSQFFFTALIPHRTRSIVRIVHREALPRLASDLHSLAEHLKRDLNHKVVEFMNGLRERHRAQQNDSFESEDPTLA